MKRLLLGHALRTHISVPCLFSVLTLVHGAEMKAVTPGAAPTTAEITKSLNDFLTFNSDPKQHDRFWAEDLVYTSSGGLVKTKAEIMQGMADAAKAPATKTTPAATYSAEDVLVRVYDQTAALTFRLVAQYPDGTRLTYRNSGTLLHRRAQWQVITWQATKEPAKEK